jgi:nucleoside-triphosphatase THEP1
MKLDAEQQEAIDAVFNPIVKSVYITGEGGSGKTFVINNIVNLCNENDRHVIVMATTNSAARLINGITVNSAFGLNLEVNETAKNHKELMEVNYRSDKSNFFAKLGLTEKSILIIDEISMMGKRSSKVLKAMRDWEKYNNGGVSTLVLVGDPEQLPPVNDAAVDWKSKCNVTVRLKTNHRAENAGLRELIDSYRVNRDDAMLLSSANVIKKIGKYAPSSTYIGYKNATLDRLQKQFLGDKPWKPSDRVLAFKTSTSHQLGVKYFERGVEKSRLIPYYSAGDELTITSAPVPAGIKGLYYVNVIKEGVGEPIPVNVNYPEPLRVLVGTYSDYEAEASLRFKELDRMRYAIRDRLRGAKPNEDIRIATLNRYKGLFTPSEMSDWKVCWRNSLSFANTPFARLSNFITAHKAQGASIDHVVVLWDDMCGKELKYTAVSRAKKSLTLVSKH